MNRFFYTFLFTLLSPLLLGWMGLRARRAGGRWQVLGRERFGFYRNGAPDADFARRGPVWVHAVSLGETRAAQPLVRALLDRGDSVLLTHMTVTGREEGRRAFAQAVAEGRLVQQWLPYDFPFSTRRFMAHYRPVAGVLIEREVWPNLLAAARRASVPMALASARFSERALARTLRCGKVLRQAYEGLTAVYAQTLQDAQRLEKAGAQAVGVSGNFKFDVDVPQDQVRRGREFAAMVSRKIVTIASTREGEDEPFIQAVAHQIRRSAQQGRNVPDEVLFCLVPRHPQRFDEAAALLERAGLPYVRRSALLEAGDCSASALQECRQAAVLLGDSLGEMPRYYAGSQVAIVAGSFAPLGGQNFIEASAVGVPVIVGPHTQNFQQAVRDAIAEDAAQRAPDPQTAVQWAVQWLDDPARLSRMGEAGEVWVKKHAGAVARVVAGLDKIKRKPD
ncbi:MAG: 3-deoxy-D-manno-octulosonic acid transferase [Candidimonas sp.]